MRPVLCDLHTFYVEKNLAKQIVCGEKMTDITYDFTCNVFTLNEVKLMLIKCDDSMNLEQFSGAERQSFTKQH